VLPDGSIEIRAPLFMTTDEINKCIEKFKPKLLPIVEQYRKINSEHPFGYGGEVLFLGKWMPIIAAEDNNSGCMAQFKDGAVVMKPNLSEDEMRHHIKVLFYAQAKPIFEEKLSYFSKLMGVCYKTWTVGNARKRHGSCDSNGKIILSWRIIMMSESVIDCIVVHELAHLRQMNHSKAFYNEIAAVLPDWKERKKAHGEYALMLRCGGWL